MKTLKQYLKYKKQSSSSINEKLIKNTKLYNCEVLDKISSVGDEWDLLDILETIIKSANKKPDIWNETEQFEASDYFEPWEDNFGESDDVYDVIEKYCNNNVVIGWKGEGGFEKLEKNIPSVFNYIMSDTDWTHDIVHKKKSCVVEVWEKKFNKIPCTLMKFNMHVNDNGKDYMEYWYMFIVDLHRLNF